LLLNLVHDVLIISLNSFVQEAGINQGRVEVCMAQNFLNVGQFHAGIQQAGGQSVAELMRRDRNLTGSLTQGFDLIFEPDISDGLTGRPDE
jgi:hypothetical protein